MREVQQFPGAPIVLISMPAIRLQAGRIGDSLLKYSFKTVQKESRTRISKQTRF
jgi:hypothetical protein